MLLVFTEDIDKHNNKKINNVKVIATMFFFWYQITQITLNKGPLNALLL